MRTALLVLALLAAPAFASQSVWKWVDEKGVTHYSDRPVPGAQRVEVTVGSRADSVPTSPSPAASPASQPPAATASYREFEIWKPAGQEVIVNTGGVVEVRMRLDPALQPGHSVYLYWNGKLVEDFPRNALEYTLREVPRGQHTVTALIQDQKGDRVKETTPVRFAVRQESIAQPPVGPALRQTPPGQRRQTSNKPITKQPSYAALNGQRPPIDPRTNAPPVQKKK